MLLKALDLLRTLGWGLITFIFSLIDSLFDIIKEMNAFSIIDSLAGNIIFKNLHTGIITISITLFALFVIWKFVSKILDPDQELTIGQILKEVFKCGVMILLSTFLYAQVSIFSIQLSGYTANVFSNSSTELSDSMLELYVDYSDGYKETNPEYNRDDISKSIKNNTFSTTKMYNEKYVTSDRWILPDEKDYIYSINWIMAVIIGGFFLYSLFFSGMMLARRQIEFLFLFLISPIVFATSIGNKQRRGAVFEQLISLVLQASVVMLIINLTALVMQAVNNTTFFPNSFFQDLVIKSLMFIGCGSFLLTGSQVVNRFIGANVSANSGREQLMSLMGFGHTLGTIGTAGGLATMGAGLLGLGAATKTMGNVGAVGNTALSKIGNSLNNFGKNIGETNNVADSKSPLGKIGNAISSFGGSLSTKSNNKSSPKNNEGLSIPSGSSKLRRFGERMIASGQDSLQDAIGTVLPSRNMYRRRYRYRGNDE